MQNIIELLLNYWKPIVGLLFTIAGFFIALIKKKPISDILTDIFIWSKHAIDETETASKINHLDPEIKLARATNFVLSKLKDKYPTLEVNRYAKVIIQVIEGYLETPQKKGGDCNGQKKTND